MFNDKIAKWITDEFEYKNNNYKDFVELCYYLVRKYGSGGDYDARLGAQIKNRDDFVMNSPLYLSDYSIISLLSVGEQGLTTEQEQNREQILGD